MKKYFEHICEYMKNSMSSYAIYDDNFRLIDTNSDFFENNVLKENISVYNKNGLETDINKKGEKYGILKQKNALTALLVTPLYYAEQLQGYTFVKLNPYELFDGKLISRKSITDIRYHVSNIISHNMIIMNSLEASEQYDMCNHVASSDYNGLKLLSMITNSEIICSMFEERNRIETMDISQTLNELLKNAQFRLGEKITINHNIQENVFAKIDKEYFVSAVMNLITNAYLYNTNENKTVTVSLKNDGDIITISVDDNGNGIDNQFKESYIPTSKPDFMGKEGLGLTVVKLFSLLHGGDMNVISKGDGIGTVVRFTFKNCEAESLRTNNTFINYFNNRFSTFMLVLTKALDNK